jgi:hypothetical protein
MPFRSDDDNLMEIFQQRYAELRREHSEYEAPPLPQVRKSERACNPYTSVGLSISVAAHHQALCDCFEKKRWSEGLLDAGNHRN